MPVPLLDVNAQNLPLEDSLRAVFDSVLRSGRFILGEEVEAFEKECAAFLGARHAISISSGTDALLVAFMALGIGPGDEVICPSFTFFATAGCIARTGAVPVFCDVCPVCFNLDVEAVRAKITPRTRAIVPVHLFGQAAEMDSLQELAREHGLFVIEDAAQAIGATSRGRSCGTMGHAGCFSFFPSKNLGGFGDGGLVTTEDDALAEKILRLRNHGMHPRYYHSLVGGNFRMDALQCALLRVKLPHLHDYAAGRSRNAARYLTELSATAGIVQSSQQDCCCHGPAARQEKPSAAADDAQIILPSVYAENGHVWNQFTLRVTGGRRDALKAHLASRGVASEIYYPVPLHLQECFADLPPHALDRCPVSAALAEEVLSIPVFPELTPAQTDEVISAVASFVA